MLSTISRNTFDAPTATLSIRQHDPVNRLYRITLRLKQPDLEVEANMIVPTLPRSSLYTSTAKPEKTVISAGMPKSRPWTVTSRMCKCLIRVTFQPAVSCSRLQGHMSWPPVCHPWTLDSGIPDRNDGTPKLLYNGERSRVGTHPRRSAPRLYAERPSHTLPRRSNHKDKPGNAKPQLGIGNLPDSAKVLEWIPVNDRVMGGASTSQTTAMADGMAFSGVVSLDLAC